MSISALVLELWQFSFIRDWPETWKSEIPSSEIFPTFEDWGKVWIQNFARMSVIKCYWMLQIYRFKVRFLRKGKTNCGGAGGGKVTRPNPPFTTQIRIKFRNTNSSRNTYWAMFSSFIIRYLLSSILANQLNWFFLFKYFLCLFWHLLQTIERPNVFWKVHDILGFKFF